MKKLYEVLPAAVKKAQENNMCELLVKVIAESSSATEENYEPHLIETLDWFAKDKLADGSKQTFQNILTQIEDM